MLFISTGILDDKLRPQIFSVGTTANSPLTSTFMPVLVNWKVIFMSMGCVIVTSKQYR